MRNCWLCGSIVASDAYSCPECSADPQPPDDGPADRGVFTAASLRALREERQRFEEATPGVA